MGGQGLFLRSENPDGAVDLTRWNTETVDCRPAPGGPAAFLTGAAVDSAFLKENVCLAREAMGTRFEVVLPKTRPGRNMSIFAVTPFDSDAAAQNAHIPTRSHAEAALEEITILDRELSLFRRDSFLSFVNANAQGRTVRVPPDLFELFALCESVRVASRGAFDITVGPLMECWGFHGGEGAQPDGDALARARTRVGGGKLTLDKEAFTLRFGTAGMRLDLGGVAKGFALDRAAETLRDEGVERALLHGGTSTVVGLSGKGVWKVGVRAPAAGEVRAPAAEEVGASSPLLATAYLENAALSVSAPQGRSFFAGGREQGHLIDPAAGSPAQGALLAAVTAKNATLADAWSTAFLVAGPEGFDDLVPRAEGVLAAMLYTGPGDGGRLLIAGPHPETFAKPETADLTNPGKNRKLEKERK